MVASPWGSPVRLARRAYARGATPKGVLHHPVGIPAGIMYLMQGRVWTIRGEDGQDAD